MTVICYLKSQRSTCIKYLITNLLNKLKANARISLFPYWAAPALIKKLANI